MKQIDNNYIGAVPGIEVPATGAIHDQNLKVQLPILGGTDVPSRSRGG